MDESSYCDNMFLGCEILEARRKLKEKELRKYRHFSLPLHVQTEEDTHVELQKKVKTRKVTFKE